MKTLSARINVRSNRGVGTNKPRFAKLSDITIRAVVHSTDGGKKTVELLTVATRTIPGVWDEQKALAEFKKNPKLFTFEKGYTADTFRNAA